MILFAIIGESLDVIYAATIIGMIIVCWAIYTVYTEWWEPQYEMEKMNEKVEKFKAQLNNHM